MLSLVFDTRASKFVYVDPPVPLIKKIASLCAMLVALPLALLIIFICSSIAGAVGFILGGLINPTVGGILSMILILVASVYSFLLAIVFIAAVGLFLRKKILGTLGYFKNGYFEEVDNRLLEFCDMDGKSIKTIDLNVYSTLVSKNLGDGIQLLLESKEGDTINLASVVSPTIPLFDPTAAKPGGRKNVTYPVDDLLASFCNIKLKKDGVEIGENKIFTF